MTRRVTLSEEAAEAVDVRLEELPPQIVWGELFGRVAPIEVDIGCGKGRFVIEASARHPERDYLGVENAGRPYYLARERIAKRGLTNARVVRADAHELVGERIPPESVSVYHVLFPDPWPKKRHHKRRVLTLEFVGHLARSLVPGGELHIATDIADYFDELLWVVESTRVFHLVEESQLDPETELITNFAAKYIEEGRTCFRAQFELVAGTAELTR